MITTILITRHGEGEHNLNTGVFMGRAPEARLTPRGREQARLLGQRLKSQPSPSRIICSSLPRTVETAEIVGQTAGISTLHSDDAFWELSKGDWEGTMPRPPPPEIQQAVDADPMGYRYGGAESYSGVESRVAPRFEECLRRYAGDTLLFVLHGDVIRALLHHIIGFPGDKISDFEIAPCSLTEIHRDGERTIIQRINDAAHMESLARP